MGRRLNSISTVINRASEGVEACQSRLLALVDAAIEKSKAGCLLSLLLINLLVMESLSVFFQLASEGVFLAGRVIDRYSVLIGTSSTGSVGCAHTLLRQMTLRGAAQNSRAQFLNVDKVLIEL